MEHTTSALLALSHVPICSLTYDVLKTPLKKNKETNKQINTNREFNHELTFNILH